MKTHLWRRSTAALLTTLLAATAAQAAPIVSRLTPPSALFTFGDGNAPYIARFLPGQRFDLQATVQPDATHLITGAQFFVDDQLVAGTTTQIPATVSGLAPNSAVLTLRAYSNLTPGVHLLKVTATQDDTQTVTATGNFEVVPINAGGRHVKNVIICIGDGMGIAHRTAARIMLNGVQMGKAIKPLSMDLFPVTGIVSTSSLNSIVTDSAPGAFCYSSGNKANNNQQGVFPDDTLEKFDNPRVELIGEYLARTGGKSLGIITTADVFDATPGAFGSHTQDRGAGTGICDGYLDEQVQKSNLTVLMGGGRKWFLPNSTPGSARSVATDAVLPSELAAAWGIPVGAADPARDLIADFQSAGFSYAPDHTSLNTVDDSTTKLLGLFSLSNMNVSKDKIDGRRGNPAVVNDYGFPDQPMLDEMADKALQVLSKNANGFVLMMEGASIDKQAHNMDTDRWLLETIEFDRAIERCRQFALATPDTLVIVTADHECAGINIIGASRVSNSDLQTRSAGGGGLATLRDPVVGTYDLAGFPRYPIAPDGYPTTTDIDNKMLIGYASNADRYEDWLTNIKPSHDSQQPFDTVAPLATYPRVDALDVGGVNPSRPIQHSAGNFFITGQVPGSSAVHTASDIPLSATGRGSKLFTGVMDNTDVFFRAMQAVIGGAAN